MQNASCKHTVYTMTFLIPQLQVSLSSKAEDLREPLSLVNRLLNAHPNEYCLHFNLAKLFIEAKEYIMVIVTLYSWSCSLGGPYVPTKQSILIVALFAACVMTVHCSLYHGQPEANPHYLAMS